MPKEFDSPYPVLYLRKNEQRRLLAGHDWIFSNEVDTKRSPLHDFTPGEWVTVCSSQDFFIGIAYINPNSLICARLLTRSPDFEFRPLLRKRLLQALELRDKLDYGNCYRLVFGEGDYLPGLVVDRYDNVLVVQLNTLGMEEQQQLIIDELDELLKPEAVVLRNDSSSRVLEGLSPEVRVARGKLPDDVVVEDSGCRYHVDVLKGQKTGWFFDQRDNRARLSGLVQDASVLDLFSFAGAWGIQAARGGASEVLCVDESTAALEQVSANAELNGVGAVVKTHQANIFDYLPEHYRQERYDVVNLDPPALIKRKKDKKNGLNAYQRLNRWAMSMVRPGGIFITSSCSHHLSRDDFASVLVKAARQAQCRLQLIYQGFQAADHPVQMVMPETAYLECLFFRVTPLTE